VDFGHHSKALGCQMKASKLDCEQFATSMFLLRDGFQALEQALGRQMNLYCKFVLRELD